MLVKLLTCAWQWFTLMVSSTQKGSAGKESACNVGDLGSIPGLGRSHGEGKGYPLQDSCPENSMDCAPWGRKVTRLSNFHFTSGQELLEPSVFFSSWVGTTVFIFLERVTHLFITICNSLERMWVSQVASEFEVKAYFHTSIYVLVALVTLMELSEMNVNMQSICFLSFRL